MCVKNIFLQKEKFLHDDVLKLSSPSKIYTKKTIKNF